MTFPPGIQIGPGPMTSSHPRSALGNKNGRPAIKGLACLVRSIPGLATFYVRLLRKASS